MFSSFFSTLLVDHKLQICRRCCSCRGGCCFILVYYAHTTEAAFNAEFGICPLCIPIGESQSAILKIHQACIYTVLKYRRRIISNKITSTMQHRQLKIRNAFKGENHNYTDISQVINLCLRY